MPLKTCQYPGCSRLVKSGYCEKHRMRERYCSFPGCPVKVSGKAFCPKHDPDNRYDLHRGSASQRGYDDDWQNCAAAYRAEHPICERCEKILDKVTGKDLLVHHIKPLPEGERLDFNNLMTVCRHCHRALHFLLEFQPDNYFRQVNTIKSQRP